MNELTLPFHFVPRTYQLPLLRAFDSKQYNRFVTVWHRRSGKDKTWINIIAKAMYEKVGSYFYVFPELRQGRKIVWDGMDRDGFRFLDHFPKPLLAGKPNDTEMKLKYKSGSVFQIVGSENFDSVVGTNPVGMVFSEYAVQNPECWGYLRPILADNGGWAAFNFTPRGENHAYELFQLAKSNPGGHWFSEVLKVGDTHSISSEVLYQERLEMNQLYGSDTLYEQEYNCSFSIPIIGSYYSENIRRLEENGYVTEIPYNPGYPVHTGWDIGNDTTAVWFFQIIGQAVMVIDYASAIGVGREKSDENGLDYFAKLLREKGYYYGLHIGPHDIKVKEWGTQTTRIETAKNLGIDFTVAPRLGVEEGIFATRSFLARCRFDRNKTKNGLNALKSYRRSWDEKRKTFADEPYHDWSSHGSDAFRTFVQGFPLHQSYGISKEVQNTRARLRNVSGWTGEAFVPNWRGVLR